MSSVTQDMRTALAAKLDDQFAVVRKYDGWNISSNQTVTIGSPKWKLVEQPDQQYGVRAIEFPVCVYQLIDGNGEKSFEYLDQAFHKVVAAIGSDRTLGNKCPSTEIVNDPESYVVRADNGKSYGILEFRIAVTPFPNVA